MPSVRLGMLNRPRSGATASSPTSTGPSCSSHLTRRPTSRGRRSTSMAASRRNERSMKALVYTGPNALDFRDEADPVPADGEVLVRVEAVGICGSDMHAYHGHDSRRPAPLILGHEAAGRIASGPNAGRRVAVNPLVTCGPCEVCAGGRAHLW